VRKSLFFTLSMLVLAVAGFGQTDADQFNGNKKKNTDIPVTVFQAAGPNAASIQSAVDQYRAALGNLNGNNPGPVAAGRREINWDGGGGVSATSPGPTPFDVFLNTRGGRFITPGTGFVQATPQGLAETFNNPTYADIFKTFSPLRLFSPVGSRVTEGVFFIPGTSGGLSASVKGFGAVFTDVDQQDGNVFGFRREHDRETTVIEYFDRYGRLLFRSLIPASPGDGGLSFFGIIFDDARIARVRIVTDATPGNDDTANRDAVMMDDFIYGEPQALPLY
jgi:hypothetical protein